MLVKLSTVSFSEDLVQGTESREGLLCLSRWRCRILASFWVWSFTHSKISLPCWVRNWKSPSPVLQPLKFKAEGVNQLTCSAVNLARRGKEGGMDRVKGSKDRSKQGRNLMIKFHQRAYLTKFCQIHQNHYACILAYTYMKVQESSRATFTLVILVWIWDQHSFNFYVHSHISSIICFSYPIHCV